MSRAALWLSAAAYHEAGHAVVSRHEGIRIKSVSIIPDETTSGRVTHHSPIVGKEIEYDSSPHTQRYAERAVRVLFAGPIAQRLFNPRTYGHYHGAGDHEGAISILSSLAGSDDEVRAYWRLLEIQTRELLQQNSVWESVKRVAEALLKTQTLSDEQVDDIVEIGGDEEPIVACLTRRQGIELLALFESRSERFSPDLRALRGQLEHKLRDE